MGGARLIFEHTFEGAFGLVSTKPDMAVRFTVWGEPLAKERPRLNRKTGSVYTPATTKKAEALVAESYRLLDDSVLFENPIIVECLFYCYKKTKRDIDNLFKLVLDGLNGVAYVDDFLVEQIFARRIFVESPAQARTAITIRTIQSQNFERLLDDSWQEIAKSSQRDKKTSV